MYSSCFSCHMTKLSSVYTSVNLQNVWIEAWGDRVILNINSGLGGCSLSIGERWEYKHVAFPKAEGMILLIITTISTKAGLEWG